MLPINKPHVRTQGQIVYAADGSIKFRLSWNRYSDRVATFSSIENPYYWENGFCTYLGLPTKAVALAWQQHLLRTGVAKVAELRKVNRLKVGTSKGVAIRWELKVRGLSYEQLLQLLTYDLSQVPPESEQKPTATDFEVDDHADLHNIAPQVEIDAIALTEPEPQLEQPAPEVEESKYLEVAGEVSDRDIEECLTTEFNLEQNSQPDPQIFQVGDRVEINSDRHGVEFDWQIGIVAAATTVGASVNVNGTLRFFCADELVLVEAAAEPRRPVDDLFPPETDAATRAYNPYPMGRKGAAANWRAIQASGGLKATTKYDPMEKWRRIEAEQKAIAESDDDF